MSTGPALARELMLDFAERTGLTGDAAPRRYLWTDAFAVCNLLGLHRETGDARYRRLAVGLVEQVHRVLGRHREDDPREGWISGLPEAEGEEHPTAGGLRIGKEQPERAVGEPPDPRREWDRDGQYLHYLTRWMHALSRTAADTGEVRYLRWARELAAVAQRAFTVPTPGGGRRLVWKMSIALDRPQVPSSGHHDPLDALLTYTELETATVGAGPREDAGPSLDDEIARAAELCQGARWVTEDPLGIGGLLGDAARLAVLVAERGVDRSGLLRQLLEESRASLALFEHASPLDRDASHRLAFRELGLALGVHGVERAHDEVGGALGEPSASNLEELAAHRPLAERIEAFWSAPDPRESPTWRDHRDINAVMLATSLSPAGYLEI